MEQVIANFVRENWSKLGLFLYFFPEGLGAGDATAIDRRGEVVGIEFEGIPYNYFAHGRHENPKYRRVRYVFCHVISDEYDKRWADRIRELGKKVMSLEDLKKRIAKGYNEPPPEVQKRAKEALENAIGECFRTWFPSFKLKEVKVKIE